MTYGDIMWTALVGAAIGLFVAGAAFAALVWFIAQIIVAIG